MGLFFFFPISSGKSKNLFDFITFFFFLDFHGCLILIFNEFPLVLQLHLKTKNKILSYIDYFFAAEVTYYNLGETLRASSCHSDFCRNVVWWRQQAYQRDLCSTDSLFLYDFM